MLALCPVCEDSSYSGNAVRNFKDCRMEVDNVTFTTLESFQFELERRMFSRAHMRCSMNPFCLDEPWASTCDVYSDLIPHDSLSIQCFTSSTEIPRYMSRNSQLKFDKWARYSAGSMIRASKSMKVRMDLGEGYGDGVESKKEQRNQVR